MELSKLTLSELKKLKARVEAEISRRTDNTRRDLLKKIQKMTAEAGLSINDVITNAAPAATKQRGKKKTAGAPKGSKVAPKYRHPQDNTLLWTGRGRQPQWVVQLIAGGKKLEDLLIK